VAAANAAEAAGDEDKLRAYPDLLFADQVADHAGGSGRRALRRDPRVPRRAKVVVALGGLWVLSPIDLLPEFLPVIGPLDDASANYP
jgi:Protein of unknown function (DUF1232)